MGYAISKIGISLSQKDQIGEFTEILKKHLGEYDSDYWDEDTLEDLIGEDSFEEFRISLKEGEHVSYDADIDTDGFYKDSEDPLFTDIILDCAKTMVNFDIFLEYELRWDNSGEISREEYCYKEGKLRVDIYRYDPYIEADEEEEPDDDEGDEDDWMEDETRTSHTTNIYRFHPDSGTFMQEK